MHTTYFTGHLMNRLVGYSLSQHFYPSVVVMKLNLSMMVKDDQSFRDTKAQVAHVKWIQTVVGRTTFSLDNVPRL